MTTLKVFISKMDTWFSNFLIEELRTDHLPKSKIQYTFSGTTESSEFSHLPYLFEPKLITITKNFDYSKEEIFDNDIIIFNLNEASLDEVEYVIKGLNSIKYETEKILILISNIMTWAKTPLKEFSEDEINKYGINNEQEIESFLYEKIYSNNDNNYLQKNINSGNKVIKEENEEENEFNEESENIKENKEINENNDIDNIDENITEEINNDNNNEGNNNLLENKNHKKIFYFREEDYPKRIPDSNYYNFKIIETLALDIKNPYCKKYIVCPGFIYGCGEDFFFDYFKKAWLGGVEYIPIRGSGYNFIPTIHIKDLIQVIKRILSDKPENNYIFACDKTKEPFLKEVLESITKGIGGIKLKSVDEYDIDDFEIINYNELKINIPIKPSPFISNPKIPFNWHSEFGIKENIPLLISEFKLYRQLTPLRIIITGPPSGGKTSLSQILSKKYKISIFDTRKVIDDEENEESDLAKEIKLKRGEIEELIKKTIEEHEHKKSKKKNEPPLDLNALKKFPNDFIGKLFKNRIQKDECLVKGYILDNFPKSYLDCQNIFCVDLPPKIKKEEENKDIKETKKDKKEKFDKDKEKEKIEEIDYNRKVIEELLPDCVIMINNYTEESLKEKEKKHLEYEEKQQEFDMRFNRRLEAYKKYNESNDINYRNLEEFFKENNVKIIYVSETEYMQNKSNIENNIFETLEKLGFKSNYSQLFDEEDEVEYIKPIVEEKEENENIINLNEEENMEINDEETNNKNMNINIDEKNKNKNIDIIKEDESEESMVRIQKNLKKKIEKRDKEKSDSINKSNKSKKKIKHHSIKDKEKPKDKSDIKEHINDSNDINNNKKKKPNKEKTVEEQLKEEIEKENNLLEKKSEVIRRYLSENIMPILAKGVLFVSRNLPDDPVESLANFLMYNSFDLNNKDTIDKQMGELEKIMQETDH